MLRTDDIDDLRHQVIVLGKILEDLQLHLLGVARLDVCECYDVLFHW